MFGGVTGSACPECGGWALPWEGHLPCHVISPARNVCLVTGMFTHLNIQMNSQHAFSKKGELGEIRVKTDLMVSRGMGHESEPAFRAILMGQNDLVFFVLHLHEQAKPWDAWLVLLLLIVIQLHLVVSDDCDFFWKVLFKALLLCLPDVEVKHTFVGHQTSGATKQGATTPLTLALSPAMNMD